MTRRGPTTPGAKPPARRRTPSPEDLDLWRAVLRDVAPLPGRAKPPASAAPPARPPDLRSSTVMPAPAATQPVTPAAPPPGAGVQRPGIDRRSAERLRRGQMAIDARLDLHGLTQAEAHDALLGFVRRGWDQGKRCVLVITGKGSAGGGVLRSAVPRWLREPPVRDKVLAVETAQPRHGGEGALYILIRRKREG